jgi:putative salt-induced outer membrane protein
VKLARLASLAALAIVPALPAMAQTEDKWTGEGAFNAGFTTGNTETRDLGVAVRGKHAGDGWTQAGEFTADYGDTNQVESRNRLAAAGQVDKIFSDQWNAYTRLTWEKDEFSGFENRYFLGVGGAYKAVDLPATKWTLEGGPGYKIDEVRATDTTLAATEESLGGRGASRFSHDFNDKVQFSDTTEIVASETSTQVSNSAALTANLMGNLSARISLDVRHDTDPLPGFEPTDTATKFSLVYKIE